MEIGSKIKKSRIDAKLTQEQAAEALGISRQTISNWENEKSYPDIVSVLKMSDLYGVSLDYLLKGDSPMKNYLDYIEESTNVVKSKVKLSKLILILSYLVIWAFNIMVSWLFFCGKYFRSTGRRIPMARASGSNDCNISFDWEKRFLGKAQVVCSDWIWPHVPVVCLCELWHERKFNLQSDRFANNHPFLYWSNCFGYRHSAWLCVFHGRKEYPKERVIYACQYINFNSKIVNHLLRAAIFVQKTAALFF